MQLDRRRFMTYLAGSSLSVGLIPKWASAQTAPANENVLMFVFLRGAADGVSMLHPAVGTSPARQKYESWRRASGTRVTGSVALTGGLAMHPAFQPLRPAIDARHFGFIPGVGGAQFNRSHFQQQDLVESGSATTTPLAEGVLGRAMSVIRGSAPGLGALALTPLVPYSLRRAAGEPPAVAVPDLTSFGALASTTHRADRDATLRTRLQRLYVPSSTCNGVRICELGTQAMATIDDLGGLVTTAQVTGALGADIASVLAADTERRIKLLTLDLGGWDTHNGQGNQTAGHLVDRLTGLVGFLKSLYDASRANGTFARLTVLVMTEFGRTTFENGTQGTDHGFGGVSLVMSPGVRAPIAPTGWFPASGSGAFYDDAESVNVIPRLIEHRQVLADVLTNRLGLTDLSAVLPGFTPSTTAPRIFR